MTKRPLNICRQCGYTWYPRGKYLSNSCPNCGSSSTEYAAAVALEQLFAIISLPFIAIGALLAAIAPPLTKAFSGGASAIGRGAQRAGRSMIGAVRGGFGWLFSIRHDFLADNQESANPLALSLKLLILLGAGLGILVGIWMLIGKLSQ